MNNFNFKRGNTVLAKHFLSLSILAAMTIGYLLPSMNALKDYLPFALGVSLFFSFLNIEFENNWRIFLKRAFISSIWRYAVVPVICITLIQAWYPTELFPGFLLIAIAPTALGAVLLAQKIDRDVEFVAWDVLIQNLLAIVMIPLISGLFLNTNLEQSNLVKLFARLILIMFIPFILAWSLKKIIPKTSLIKFSSTFRYFNSFAIVFIIFVAVNLASAYIKKSGIPWPELSLVTVFLLVSMNYSCGFWLGQKLKTGIIFSFVMGYRNTSLILWVVLTFFNSAGAIPIVFYILVQHLYNVVFLGLTQYEEVETTPNFLRAHEET